ncbi:MAG: MBL fold metallo-hydrolase [Candidatus Freyarchaeota archaeon]
MKITFLGTAGSMITKSRTNPSVLVDEDLLIDCGEGTSQKLLAILGDLSKIDSILISHGHADHIMGITSLLWAMWLSNRRNKDLKIIGPEYIEALVTSLLKLGYTPLDRLTFRINYAFDTHSYENIFFKPTLHYPTNFAYRIERRGKSICYTGDTAPCEGLIDLAEKCDVLIHEAAFPDELSNLAHKLNHSTPSDAGQLASKANVRILALVHWPDTFEGNESILIDQARRSFDGEIILAKDLDVLEL